MLCPSFYDQILVGVLRQMQKALVYCQCLIFYAGLVEMVKGAARVSGTGLVKKKKKRIQAGKKTEKKSSFTSKLSWGNGIEHVMSSQFTLCPVCAFFALASLHSKQGVTVTIWWACDIPSTDRKQRERMRTLVIIALSLFRTRRTPHIDMRCN